MKTQIKNSLSSITTALFLVAIIFFGSCNDRKVSTQKSIPSQSTSKAPAIDIHAAVVSGNVEAIKQHLAAGTNINEKDPFGGSSPLISASLFGKTEIARMLIDAGAEINLQNNDGSTALHTASFFCRPEIVVMLLKKGSDKTIKNKFGSTSYESVVGSFAEVKQIYEMMGKMLEPMGLKLDYSYIEKTRPDIAAMLK